MYKLILVDDEENVREGVRREIDWAALGFEVIGVAENGKEATEMIERDVPDVVVTDIKMPFMDGLELSAWMKERYPAVRIVILTGFDEFEYAQKAVKLLIDEYVLKPFTSDELIQALLKVKGRLESESSRREDMQVLQEHYRKSLPVLKENFLISLVTRQLSRRDVEDKSALYELPLEGQGFVAAVISLDSPDVEGHSLENGVRGTSPPTSSSLKDSADKELQLFAILNITEEIAAEHKLGIPFIHSDRVVLLTATPEFDQDAITNTALPILNEIRQSVERYLKLTVTIGVGTVRESITDLKYSYEDAVLALDYRLVHGSNRVIWINDVEIGSWTSPGDFGDHRGKLNPAWWNDSSTQHGLLKTWAVDLQRSMVDNDKCSMITLSDLHLQDQPYITFRIGLKPDAKHQGGMNLFGKNFGNHPQGIIMRLQYD